MVYSTRKKDVIKLDTHTTNSILDVTPPTKVRKEVVIAEMRNASRNAIKRGLNDMIRKRLCYRLS
jgi:hypothetical protein